MQKLRDAQAQIANAVKEGSFSYGNFLYSFINMYKRTMFQIVDYDLWINPTILFISREIIKLLD